MVQLPRRQEGKGEAVPVRSGEERDDADHSAPVSILTNTLSTRFARRRLGDAARVDMLRRRGVKVWKSLISKEAKRMKFLLSRAVHLFQGSVLVKCLIEWKEFVAHNLALKRAVGFMNDGLRMRCFAKLKRYLSWRRERGSQIASAKEQHIRWLLGRGLSQLKSLVSEEAFEVKRKIAKSMSWFVDSTRAKCFYQWHAFVREHKKMRHALGIFQNGLVFRCLVKWRGYVQSRHEKAEREGLGDEHWQRRATKRYLKRWLLRCAQQLEYKVKLRHGLSWFVNATIKRCFWEWASEVEHQKKLRRALAMFTQDLKVKKWFQWKSYVLSRRKKAESMRVGLEFWRKTWFKKGLSRLTENGRKEGQTRALLLKARHWFFDIILYKTFAVWKGSVSEAKMIKKAMLTFRGCVVLKCFLGWRR